MKQKPICPLCKGQIHPVTFGSHQCADCSCLFSVTTDIRRSMDWKQQRLIFKGVFYLYEDPREGLFATMVRAAIWIPLSVVFSVRVIRMALGI